MYTSFFFRIYLVIDVILRGYSRLKRRVTKYIRRCLFIDLSYIFSDRHRFYAAIAAYNDITKYIYKNHVSMRIVMNYVKTRIFYLVLLMHSEFESQCKFA